MQLCQGSHASDRDLNVCWDCHHPMGNLYRYRSKVDRLVPGAGGAGGVSEEESERERGGEGGGSAEPQGLAASFCVNLIAQEL